MNLDLNPFDHPLLRYFGFWMIGGVGLFYVLVRLAAGSDLTVDATSGGILLQLLAFLPILWLFWQHLGKRLHIDLFFNRNRRPFRWLELVLLWVVIILFSYSVERLTIIFISWWSPAFAQDLLEQPMIEPGLSSSINVLNVALAMIVGPVMEEFVFRALILQRLMVKYGTSSAIVLSSIFFGILHFENLISASVFGLMMCLLFLQSRNLWLPILFHITNNGLAVCLNIWQHNREDSLTSDVMIRLQWHYILPLSVTPIIIYFVWKYWSNDPPGLPYSLNFKQLK